MQRRTSYTSYTGVDYFQIYMKNNLEIYQNFEIKEFSIMKII